MFINLGIFFAKSWFAEGDLFRVIAFAGERSIHVTARKVKSDS
jgi:hypothetical protein